MFIRLCKHAENYVPFVTSTAAGRSDAHGLSTAIHEATPIEAVAAGLVLRSVWVIPVLVGKLFAREDLIYLRQELIERRALVQSGCPLASVGEREERALVV